MKTILFLMNGFGYEQKDSFSVYNKELFPKFDELRSKCLNESLESDVSSIVDGYRNLSMDIHEMYNYSIVKNAITDDKFLNNDVIKNFKEQMTTLKSKVHIFCLVDGSTKLVDQLRTFFKHINRGNTFDVFLHPILVSNNVEDYKKIAEVLSKINTELIDYVRIGVVMGLNSVSNNIPETDMNFNVKIFVTEVAERWQSFTQKFDVNYGIKQAPVFVKPFIVNKGFKFTNNDLFFVWNYDQINLTKFMTTIKNINFGSTTNNIQASSLFPMECGFPTNHVFEPTKAFNSFATISKQIGFKTLFMGKKEDLTTINYYLNGLDNVKNDDITYVDFAPIMFKPTELLNMINTYPQELIILNYDIGDVKDIKDLKLRLKNIDIMLTNIFENGKMNPYSIVISSLYGINKILLTENDNPVNVNYSGKVPLVLYDNHFGGSGDYILSPGGTINEIMKICYKCINEKKYKKESILNRKTLIYRLFFK